ncbi:MAG TPA: carboxypeptidase regulatory-like domain-containing protein [Vicinamibacterales bacterium]|nr:carboxypeptidase regulatory-like domain-containing protein [Vicinamibacterales bacterium]
MARFATVLLATVFMTTPVVPAWAQTGDANIRGSVKDQQGALLPGVTITAQSPSLLAPVTTTSDHEGFYRLLNLPPATYTITAELSGFSSYRREAVVMRAGLNVTIDIALALGNLAETVTVSGDSPMIETSRPTSVINVEGELLRAAPITSRRLFSDALDMAPGIGSRNVDDGVGRRAYYFRGSHIYAHAFQLDGAPASAYIDSAAHSMGMGGDTVQDVEIKLGGADASTPLSTGVVMNVVPPSGQNQFKGSFSYSFQPMEWNGDNTKGGAAPGGLPTSQSVNQIDFSLGGRIVKDRIWFFSSYRYADLQNGISRTPTDLTFLTAFKRDFVPFDNNSKSRQPFVRLTSAGLGGHTLSGFFQNDRNRYTSSRERNTDQVNYNSAGGSMYVAKLDSVWGRMVTQFSASYNNKGGNDEDTYNDAHGSGPRISVHQIAPISSGRPTGNGELVTMNNVESRSIAPSNMLILRGDVTFLPGGRLSSHEFKTGIWAAPRLRRDITSRRVEDGFILEEVRQRDPGNPGAGTVPFHRRYETPVEFHETAARDRDIGIYIQDAWKPIDRLTINAGVRADFVRRFDDIYDVERMNSVNIGPRFGFALVLTGDHRNVLRGSAGRIHEQVNGRDPITTFATTSSRHRRDIYDADGDGVFEQEIITPAATNALNAIAFDPKLHQPFIDEFVLGFAKQFPAQISLDVSTSRRVFRDGYAEIDINGIYPSGPNQAFQGFGLVDPNRGLIMQQTNATWSRVVVQNVEAIIAKNLSHNFQLMTSVTRQWQHLEGTWNPTDPARFIQPDAFPNNRDLSRHLFGNGDDNSLDGGGNESGVAYRPYSLRMAGTYHAPWGVRVSGSYVIQAGGYVGPLIRQIAAADPVFGPGSVRLANGTTQPNPLATTWRFVNATRGDGQFLNETARYLQMNLNKSMKFGTQSVEAGLGMFNVFNTGAHTQWNTGAQRVGTALYQSRFNRHPPRAFQLTVGYKF